MRKKRERKTGNQLWKRGAAMLLSLVMVIGLITLESFAAGETGDVETFSDLSSYSKKPDQLQNGVGDPYGETGPFNLAVQNELLHIAMMQGNKVISGTENIKIGTDEVYGSAYPEMKSIGGTRVADTAGSEVMKEWSYIEAVGFDAEGVGRDTHIAYVGYEPSTETFRLHIYNGMTGEAPSVSSKIADASWVADLDGYSLMQFNASNFLDIAAGDFDGDGKESVVVFASADGTGSNTTLKEYYLLKNQIFFVYDFSNALLHQPYLKAGMGGDEDAALKLQADLAVGDFDGDKKDDLAVLSYYGANMGKNVGTDPALYAPYLSIAMGCGSGNIVNKTTHATAVSIYDAEYHKENTILTMTAPSVSVGDIDGDGDEDVVAGGYGFYLKYDDSGAYKNSDIDGSILVAAYDVSAEGTDAALNNFLLSQTVIDEETKGQYNYIISGMKEWQDPVEDAVNMMTVGTIYQFDGQNNKHIALPQFSLECVATNGQSAAEDLFVNGTFVKYNPKGDTLDYLYQDQFFNKVDLRTGGMNVKFSYITNTAVGGLDDNLVGREQIAYTVYQKDSEGSIIGTTDNADDYSIMQGISGGIVYDDSSDGTSYGQVASYGTSGLDGETGTGNNSEKVWYDNTGMDCDSCRNVLYVAVDIDYDGIVAEYAGYDWGYSNPEVVAVLQAAPYYKAFGYLNDGKTSYTVSTRYEIGQTTGASTSFSVGTSLEAQAICVKTSISAGYTQTWEENFTNAFAEEYSTTFTATSENVVVMQKTPVIVYKYLIQNSEGNFVDGTEEAEGANYITIAMPCQPVYALDNVENYNSYVTSEGYKNLFAGSGCDESHMLQPITFTAEGLPAAYQKMKQKMDPMGVLLANEGDPSYYAKSFQDLNGVNLSDGIYEAGTVSGSFTSIYSSESSATEEQSASNGFYFDAAISMGGGAFGVEAWAGVETGVNGNQTQGSYVTCADATSVSGTVSNLGEANLPREMLKPYVFNWRFGCWQIDLGVKKVFVYGYEVTGAAETIAKVENLTAADGEDSAEETVVLRWDALEGAAGYHIYLYEDGVYTKYESVGEETSVTLKTADLIDSDRQTKIVFAVTAAISGGESLYSDRATYYRKTTDGTETPTVVPTETETPTETEAPTETESPTETEAPEQSVTENFEDVYQDWYTGYVQYVYDHSLMTGIKGTAQFQPNANITKAQVAQVLFNMEGAPEAEVENARVFEELSDVYKPEWYAAAVAWAYENGIVTGDLNAKKFFPNADVTREQLALMMYRYAQYKEYDTTATSDYEGLAGGEQVANWSEAGVKWAIGAGLISGIEKNGVKDIAPQGNASRAQVAAILQRFCEKVR